MATRGASDKQPVIMKEPTLDEMAFELKKCAEAQELLQRLKELEDLQDK